MCLSLASPTCQKRPLKSPAALTSFPHIQRAQGEWRPLTPLVPFGSAYVEEHSRSFMRSGIISEVVPRAKNGYQTPSPEPKKYGRQESDIALTAIRPSDPQRLVLRH
jgi:hypothetical protein